MSDWHLRVRLHGLELDAQTLARDPVRNRRELTTLAREIEKVRRQLGASTGYIYAVAVELSYRTTTVRVIADNASEAHRLEHAWLRSHPGGGSVLQRADYSVWAAPFLGRQPVSVSRRSA